MSDTGTTDDGPKPRDDQLFRLMVENVKDFAIFALDPRGRVSTWNAGAERVFGWAEADILGRDGDILFTPEDRAAGVPLQEMTAAREVGRAEDERWHVRKDGTRFFASGVMTPILDGHLHGYAKVCRDITDRKRAEDALTASEARYRAIIDATPECVKLVAADGTLLQMNPAGLAMVEADDPGQAIGGSVYGVIAEADRGEYRAFNERVCRGEGGTLRFEIVGLKGTRRDMETTAVPLPVPAGGYAQLAVTRDVTDQKRAEEGLRTSEERFRTTADNAPVLIWIADATKACVWLNRPWLEFTGRAMAQEAGDGWADGIHPDDRAHALATYATNVDARRPFSMEYRLRRHDGEYRWLLDTGHPLSGPGGEFTGFIGSCVDITDRKAAEATLARDALLLANVHDAVVVTDLDGVVTYWNDGAARLFGWAPEDMIGRPYADRFPEPVRGWIAGEMRSRVENGTDWSGEYEDYRKDGSRVWIDARVSPLRDAGGRPIGVLGLSHDISERKRAEDALKDADRRKDEFLALLAHELRNPLAPIRNGLQVVRLSADRDIRARAQAMMDRQLAHMVRLIDDLLDVSRITRNKMELRRDRVTLAEVVGAAVETARPPIDEAGHELTVALPPAPVVLDADPVRLSQVFSNLLTNSAKYTPANGRIWLTAALDGRELVATVRDTGIGIPADALPSIFDMFSQVDRSVEKSTGGLGIGLALVKGLTEMHGGTVTAASGGSGAGTTFTVRLPVVGGAATPSGSIPHPAPRGPRRRVLVVDDNRDGADSLAEVLGLLGHEVHTAHDGVEAVAAADRVRPDLILMDVGMPRLNGLDATRQIRERPWAAAVTVIALTGWGQDNDRERSRDAGCDGHLVKPVGRADLENLLGEVARPRPA